MASDLLKFMPGYAGYSMRREQQQGEDAADLRNQSALMQLAQHALAQRQTADTEQRNEALRAAIAALPPEKRTRENVLPLILQHSKDVGQVVSALPSKAEGFSLPPEHTRYDASGNPIVTAPAKAEAPRQKDVRPVTVMKNGKPTVIDANTGAELGEAPPTKEKGADAVTPVTIIEPGTGKAIIVDGRTGKKIGDAIKETPEQVRAAKMRGLGAAIDEAEDILSGVKRDAQGNVTSAPKPTSSGVGSAVDATAGFFGMTPQGAAEAQRLKVVSGVLISKVPRMEGPQSNLDVELYKQMAGEAGNEKLPIARRLAAIREMKKLYAKYEHLQPTTDAGGPQPAPTSPSPTPAPASPTEAPSAQEGQESTSKSGKAIVFRNGKWVYK